MGAKLNFRVPAEAKLFVDGRLTGDQRDQTRFTTPPLAPGRSTTTT